MKKIYFIFLFLGILGTFLVNFLSTNIGGMNFLYLPFPVRIITCGSSYALAHFCSYDYIWWGIIASILFWIFIILIPYFFSRK